MVWGVDMIKIYFIYEWNMYEYNMSVYIIWICIYYEYKE